MHFWSLFTSQSVAPGTYADQILQVTLPQLAFENPYLLDVMLGISSLHLQSLVTSTSADRQQTALYRANAFSGFREALPMVTTTKPGSWESALLTSIMLTMLCAKDFQLEEGDLHVLHWINLYRGLSSVISLGQFNQVMSSVVAPLFKRSLTDLKIEPVVPYNLYEMLQNISPGDPDFPHLSTYREILDYIGVLYASLIQDGNSPALQTRVVSWCSLIQFEGAMLARERRPRMLILLAHYLVFVKICSRDVWWMEGTGEGDISRIFRMVPPRYFHLLDLPRACATMENPADVVDLMLRWVSYYYFSWTHSGKREEDVLMFDIGPLMQVLREFSPRRSEGICMLWNGTRRKVSWIMISMSLWIPKRVRMLYRIHLRQKILRWMSRIW